MTAQQKQEITREFLQKKLVELRKAWLRQRSRNQPTDKLESMGKETARQLSLLSK